MAELKTRPNDASVEKYLQQIEPERRKQDGLALLALMQKITGEEPRMWGASIVGFGDYHYRYASGREGDWFRVGFSPRKQALSLYFMTGVAQNAKLLSKLGKHRTGKGCLYINKLEDVDLNVLAEMIGQSYTSLPEN